MNNIFLIGYRATGKTSVGKMLAEDFGWSFADSDSEIMKQEGMSISEIVSEKGWDFFREKERAVIKRLLTLDIRVVATGEGVVLNSENIKDMQSNGAIVWLRAKPETIRKRMALQDEITPGLRPALTSEGAIEEILAARTPLYENAMDFYIRTDRFGVDVICRAIANKLRITIS